MRTSRLGVFDTPRPAGKYQGSTTKPKLVKVPTEGLRPVKGPQSLMDPRRGPERAGRLSRLANGRIGEPHPTHASLIRRTTRRINPCVTFPITHTWGDYSRVRRHPPWSSRLPGVPFNRNEMSSRSTPPTTFVFSVSETNLRQSCHGRHVVDRPDLPLPARRRDAVSPKIAGRLHKTVSLSKG